jgi:hypothetical protein
MCMSSPNIPPPPPVEPLPAPTVDPAVAVTAARNDQQNRARSAAGSASTIATSPLGDTTQANTTQKKLIGQ